LLELLDCQSAARDPSIGALGPPLSPPIEPLDTVPGLDATAARVLLAEMGMDRSRGGTEARLASRAGVCPGHDARAGKRRRGKPRKGKRDLRRVLGPCAWAARKTPP
jgi:transposase